MTELKTLKDIPKNYLGGERLTLEQYQRELKAEAVKWVKKFYNPNKTTMEIKNWINFFNLTEEDLK